MIIITFNIPDNLAAEINEIAQERGFANGKEMVRDYLRNLIANQRAGLAADLAREETIQRAMEETEQIT